MAKNKIPMDNLEDDFDLDVSLDSAMVAEKMPADITGGAVLMEGFMHLQCSELIPFQSKGNEDFSPLDEEAFSQLVTSIGTVGVLEPIIVRRNQGKFEVLAGEHRWKASKKLDLPTIPAHVVVDCDDEQAMMIFTITNLARRKSTLRDLVNGWWLVGRLTRYQRSDKIQQLVAQGLISDLTESISKRQQQRYASLHDLEDELLLLVEKKQISLESAGKLAKLSTEYQQDLLAFSSEIRSKEQVDAICALALRGGEHWTLENLSMLLCSDQKPATPQPFSFRSTRELLKKRIPQEHHGRIQEIVQEALDLYKEKHPGTLL